MGQGQQRKKDEEATGRNLPDADGQVSTEDVNAIDDKGIDNRTGQDHSLDNYGDTWPEEGVGAVQDPFDRGRSAANISDD